MSLSQLQTVGVRPHRQDPKSEPRSRYVIGLVTQPLNKVGLRVVAHGAQRPDDPVTWIMHFITDADTQLATFLRRKRSEGVIAKDAVGEVHRFETYAEAVEALCPWTRARRGGGQ